MADRIKVTRDDVLLVVDVQNDFVSGSLAIPQAETIVPVINGLIGRFAHVIAAQDWHPAGHISFASAHPGRGSGEMIDVSYGPQRLFNDHCVQGTAGAEFYRDLDLQRAELIIRKGYRKDVDSYSAFFENDQKTATGLAAYLHARGFRRVFCAGLALFGCVKATAEGARREQFEAVIIADASKARPVADDANERAERALRDLGVSFVMSTQIEF
jgi:nicotinamidase/pyrazinamidase